MIIYLYTKNDCVYCDVMKEKLKEWNVPYQTVNVSDNIDGLNFLKDNGFRTVPQIIVDNVSMNDGIDTRLFTVRHLLDRMTIHIQTNQPNSWIDVPVNIREWAEGVINGVKSI